MFLTLNYVPEAEREAVFVASMSTRPVMDRPMERVEAVCPVKTYGTIWVELPMGPPPQVVQVPHNERRRCQQDQLGKGKNHSYWLTLLFLINWTKL